MSLAVRADRSWLRHFAFWRPPFSKRRILLTGLILFICLATTYFTAYGTLLGGQEQLAGIDLASQKIIITTLPFYSFQRTLTPSQSRWLEIFFEPAHQADRWIRPETWSPPSTSPDPLIPTFSQPQ